jgi:hypothetical protein
MDGSQGRLRPESVGMSEARLKVLDRVMAERYVDGGFLPGHPVKLMIDGNLVTTLTASSAGTVSYTLSPSALGLSAGHHALTLQSMLITTTAVFTSQ